MRRGQWWGTGSRKRPPMAGACPVQRAWMLGLAVLACAPHASAQLPPSRLVVLRGEEETSAAASFIAELDRVLLDSLARDGGFSAVSFSPTPFTDVQILAECAGPEAPCLKQVAAALQDDWVLLREWKQHAAGELELVLRAQDGIHADTERTERASVPQRGVSAAAAQVRELVIRIYAPAASTPGAATVARAGAANQHRVRAANEGPKAPRLNHALLRGPGWVSFAGGAGLLAYGTAMGIKSRRAHDDYQRIDVRTVNDVNRSSRQLDRSQQLAARANRFFVAGASFALAGVLVLAWDALRPAGRADRALALNVVTTHGGAGIQLSGQLGRP